ncbi:MAG: molybdopterin-containing oxidoreductase family protein [Acidimicrobiales bacterium]
MTTTSVLGTCHHDCPDSCGWIATAKDGVLVEMRGNPDHPYSTGELCPKVNRFAHRVNSTDRLLSPMVRSGPKGSGEFREATWDEALAAVVERVGTIHQEFGGQSIFPWHSAGTQGMIQQSSVDRAFFASLGSSVQSGSICGQGAAHGMAATYGAPLGADPLQLVHSELVVLWGTNTRLTNRHLWPFIEQARANGARVVVVDPVRTITADRADQHIAPRPGTDMALLLAMLHVIIHEAAESGWVDHEYVEQYATGYDELAASVRSHTPEWAADRCGVDAAVIREFARDYAIAKPAFIRGLVGAEHQDWGGMVFRTLSCLPVITGSWRHRGGGFSRSVGSWSEVSDVDLGAFDRHGIEGVDTARRLPQSQLGQVLTDPDLDPPVKALFVWNGNPLVSMPNAGAVRAGLERDDLFTVVSEQFLTDTARYADVIFPAATQVENRDVVQSWGHLWLGWNEPAIEPRGEAVPNTELFRRLAGAFGFTNEMFERSDEELIELALSPSVDRDELRSAGFTRVSGTDDLTPYAEGGFHTPDGRARLAGSEFDNLGLPRVPTWIDPLELADTDIAGRYPLVLSTPKKQTRFLNTSYSGLEGHRGRESGPFVELSPADAVDRGLADGDRASVFNDRGRLELEVRVSDRLLEGLVSVPWGWWAEAYGPTGVLVNDLTNDQPTDQGGGAAYNVTRVQVEEPAQP